MVYKHAVVAAFAFMLSVVKMLLKGEAGGRALNSHENYIVDRGKSWKNHGIVVLNICGNPVFCGVSSESPGEKVCVISRY